MLKFNQKHQNKLITLCREYFPEHSMIVDGLINDKGNKHEGDKVFCWFYHNNKKKDFYVHWFELVMILLPKLMWGEFKTIRWYELIKTIDKGHPIDYLFNEYKNLKNEKTN